MQQATRTTEIVETEKHTENVHHAAHHDRAALPTQMAPGTYVPDFTRPADYDMHNMGHPSKIRNVYEDATNVTVPTMTHHDVAPLQPHTVINTAAPHMPPTNAAAELVTSTGLQINPRGAPNRSIGPMDAGYGPVLAPPSNIAGPIGTAGGRNVVMNTGYIAPKVTEDKHGNIKRDVRTIHGTDAVHHEPPTIVGALPLMGQMPVQLGPGVYGAQPFITPNTVNPTFQPGFNQMTPQTGQEILVGNPRPLIDTKSQKQHRQDRKNAQHVFIPSEESKQAAYLETKDDKRAHKAEKHHKH